MKQSPKFFNTAGPIQPEIYYNVDPLARIIPEMICCIQDRIICRRDKHIDILIEKLHENRVRCVIDSILEGENGIVNADLKTGDIEYVKDLGLIVCDKPLRIANAIYKEIINREYKLARLSSLW